MLQIPNFKRYVITEGTAALIGTGVSAAIGGGSMIMQGSMNKKTREFNKEQAEIQRAWNEKMYEKQNEWNLNAWNMTNEYNDPTHQVQRLRDAGLNPLYYGLDGTSANAFEAAQPLGYERAEADNQVNPMSVGIEGYTQMRNLQKDIELKNAQIDKIKSDTHGQELDNEFKEKTMAARVEAEQLGNDLTKEQIGKIKQEQKSIEQDIKKKIEETKSEVERQALLAAQTAVQKASEKEIVELLPYRQLLLEAQTDAQKAAACASYWNAMYQRGLVTDGYLDALTKDMENQAKASAYEEGIQWNKARQAAYEADAQQFRNSVRNGTTFKSDSFGAKAANTLLQATSTVAEALGGSLVPLVGGYMLGNRGGRSNNQGTVTNPNVSGRSTVLYGPNGEPAVQSTWNSNSSQ